MACQHAFQQEEGDIKQRMQWSAMSSTEKTSWEPEQSAKPPNHKYVYTYKIYSLVSRLKKQGLLGKVYR